MVAEIIAGIERRGGTALPDPVTDVVRVNGEFTALIVLARCFQTGAGSLRWRIQLDTEPLRVCRRLIDLSYAAMASVSRAA